MYRGEGIVTTPAYLNYTMDMIKVIQYGLGSIGSSVAREILNRKDYQLVGAVDSDPSKVGRDIGDVVGVDTLGFPVVPTPAEIVEKERADVVIHATSSFLDTVTPQILEILSSGLPVVSSAEELSFPWHHHPEEAEKINSAALSAGTTVLGTGVNPGFLMDVLPLSLTALSLSVEHISVERKINASLRRGAFQSKIGSGLTEEQFREKTATGRMGHIGLNESAAMVFQSFGKRLDRIDGDIQPIIAGQRTITDHFDVPAGDVIGLDQELYAFDGDREFLYLHFVAALDAQNEGDRIRIGGSPELTMLDIFKFNKSW